MNGDSSNSIKVQELVQLLAIIQKVKPALPTLLRTLSPTSQDPAPEDIAALYKQFLNETWTNLRELRNTLNEVGGIITTVEQNAGLGQLTPEEIISLKQIQEEMYKTHPQVSNIRRVKKAEGEKVVVPPPPGWDKLFELMDEKPKPKHTGLLTPVSTPRLSNALSVGSTPSPSNSAELKALLANYSTTHKEFSIKLKGNLMDVTGRFLKAICSMAWSDSRVLIERVVCYGLNEQKPFYVPSQFQLYQQMSNEAMGMVYRSLEAIEQEELGSPKETPGTNIVQILDFLYHPPLPFNE